MTLLLPNWQPQQFNRLIKALDTSMGTCEVMTDVGRAYLKPMGNRQGPHHLACEWVGTRLARWFGLQTFDFAILRLDDDIELDLTRSARALPGPAFVTRAEDGNTWGGGRAELDVLVNPGDIGRLVVFDNWVLNCDRHPPDLTTRRPNPDNVFLSREGAAPGRSRLVAMDQSHCFILNEDLSPRINRIEKVKDERVYCLFPGFDGCIQRNDVEAAVQRLREFDSQICSAIVNSIPSEWEVSEEARAALVELLCRRASFLSDVIVDLLGPLCWDRFGTS